MKSTTLVLAALLPLAFADPAKYNMDYRSQEKKIEMVFFSSWEQGVAADAIAELEFPEYSVYGCEESSMKPLSYPAPNYAHQRVPLQIIQFGLSAAVRQSPDGRLSQLINDALDGASLDGASAGLAVLVGTVVKNSYSDYLANAALKQMNYVLYTAPRTSTGAISHRAATKSYWADAVYVGFPFIAAYGAVTKNETYLQVAYDQCRLYRDALRIPEAGVWAHIYDDDKKSFDDKGLWATGNAWAAKGMLNVATIIEKSNIGNMTTQVSDLKGWVKEVLNGTFSRLDEDNLVPNYMDSSGRGNGDTFGDAAASALLAATAYRAATLWPSEFGSYYTDNADKVKESVMDKIDDLGLLRPIVDPVSWHNKGILGTESQAFGIMMYAAWRDWVKSAYAGRFKLRSGRARHFSRDTPRGNLI